MTKPKRRESLVGWIRKDWILKMCRGNAKIPMMFPTDKVYYDMEYVPSVKVHIIVEEI